MAEDYILYGFWRSLAAYRVRVALALKGLNVVEHSVDLLTGEQNAKEIVELNPQARVPILIEGDQQFAQSLAILEYLEETHPTPALLPQDPVERAHIRAFALINIADVHPVVVPIVRKRLAEQFGADEDAINDWARNWHQLGLAQMEALLIKHGSGSSKFAFGDNPGFGDIALASQVAGSRVFGADLDGHPNVLRVHDACMELDAFSKNSPQAMLAAIQAKS